MNTALVVPARIQTEIPAKDRAVPIHLSDWGPEDSALCALTDFRRDHPFTVEPQSTMDSALADMTHLGVHALLVTVDDVDELDHRVVGLITYYDIERRRPHRSPGGAAQLTDDFKVADVMTPWNELSLVHYDSLAELTVRELFQRFQGTGLTHLLVVEMRIDDSAVARGLISRRALAEAVNRRRTGNN
jgi:CBS domain-containing protein